MSSQIKELQEEIRRLCTEKGWRENLGIGPAPREGYAFPAYIALAHSELSEALEAYREKGIFGDAAWSWTSPGGKPMGVGPELADVFIRLLDMCDIWDIDIEYEVKRVIECGWTRPYQHGGKVL